MNATQQKTSKGTIEVICGSMFSGKTEELLRRIHRCVLAHLRVELFKPDTDQRYKPDAVVSHMGRELPCQSVSSSSALTLLASSADVVAIDEAQFFDLELVSVCQNLANAGKRVIIAGLDMDSNAQPFGPIPHLMAVADQVSKVQAICANCGDLAYVSYRISKSDSLVYLGEKKEYKPLCRSCYFSISDAQ